MSKDKNTSKDANMSEQLFHRIQTRLDFLGLTAREVSLKATDGANPDLVRNLKRARSQGLKGHSLLMLASVLGVTPQWLEGNATNRSVPGVSQADRGLMRVPLIAWIHAGQMHTDTVAQDTLGEMTVGGLDPAGDWVAMRVTGDSMDRISPPDSVILVDRADRELVPNGCYVIYDGDDGTTYKRFRANPPRFEPVSTNPTHEPLFYDREPEVFGRVKKTILDL
jgi:phage repressor protein C with HTH and peptisase S24 domain